ncbi:unnamed protein product [Mesocestoides corti]|uniref:Uncharacterized protein n=1 Tax=Mesocestoides corti TaxID=53468 RepID=A0A0R3UR38_MESCO|nr:unnamed protein product [Mesocestoides corti]
MHLELEEAEVCHLKEVILRKNIYLDSRDTPVVMAHEAKTAADTALQQLTDYLATLGARLQFDVSGACLLTPEATSLAGSVASILKEREQKTCRKDSSSIEGPFADAVQLAFTVQIVVAELPMPLQTQ